MTGNAQELDEIFTKYTKQVIDMCHGNRPDVADESAKAKQAITDWRDKAVVEARNELLDALENHKKTLDYIVIDGAPMNPTNYEVYMKKALEVDTRIAKLEAEL